MAKYLAGVELLSRAVDSKGRQASIKSMSEGEKAIERIDVH